MSVNVTLNGTIYAIPTAGDKPSTNWGTNVKNYLVALSTGVLSKAGGDFFLTGAVDFGPSYGIKSTSYSTRAAIIATAGSFRMGVSDVISWRNNANNRNLDLGVNASDQLIFNGSTLQSQISVADTATIDMSFSANSLSAIIVAASITNSHISGSAGIDYSKLAALASGNILVGSAGNVATSVTMSGQATISNLGAITLDNDAVIAKTLTGWTPGAGTITAEDSILSGMQKLQGNFASALTNPMNAFGDLIYGGISGAPTRLAASTAGYLLQTNGAGFAPTWVANTPGFTAPAPVTLSVDATISSGYPTYASASGLAITFTTTTTNQRVLIVVRASVFCAAGGSGYLAYTLDGGSDQPTISLTMGAGQYGNASHSFVVTPATAASHIVQIRGAKDSGNYIFGSTGGSAEMPAQIGAVAASSSGGGGGSSSLTDGHIFVGNASNTATDVAMSGVIAITNAGVTSYVAGSITNAAISASAAIARTKLASGSNNHVVVNDGSGVMTSEAALSPVRGGMGVVNDVLSTVTITGAFPLVITLGASTALTFPSSGTLLTTTAVQAVTNKDYNGGTASDTSRFTISKNTTTNLAALTRKEGNIFYDTTLQQLVYDTGSALVALQSGATRTWYTTVYTANATWTKSVRNPLVVKVTVIAGGAGAGGATALASSGFKQYGEGSGGGGGGTSIRTIQASLLGATEAIVVGTGGAGGNTSGGNGAAGNTSSFGSWATASGGAAGLGMTSNNGSASNASASNKLGGQGGIGASGDLNIRGDDGGNGVIWTSGYDYGQGSGGNFGGGTFMAGRRRSTATGGNGSAGYAYGGGGSGARSTSSGTSGGAGATGVVIVEEFA